MYVFTPSGKHTRFHWRPSIPVEREKAVEVVTSLDALHVVVIGHPLRDGQRQERARRKVLERLLYELDTAGVEQAWLESRTAVLNRRDIAAIGAWRAQRVIGHTMRVDHEYPSTEPLLWIADIVAGAVNSEEVGYWRHLEPLVTEHRIELD